MGPRERPQVTRRRVRFLQASPLGALPAEFRRKMSCGPHPTKRPVGATTTPRPSSLRVETWVLRQESPNRSWRARQVLFLAPFLTRHFRPPPRANQHHRQRMPHPLLYMPPHPPHRRNSGHTNPHKRRKPRTPRFHLLLPLPPHRRQTPAMRFLLLALPWRRCDRHRRRA